MKNYNLKNDFLRVTISSFGAEIKSVINLETNIEYFWQADKEIWGRTAPILFPIIGKEDGNGILIENVSYTIPQHGFARDNNFDLFFESKNQIIFVLTDKEITKEVYPYKFKLFVTYILEGITLHQKFTVINYGNKPLYYSIGAHPGFNLPSGILENYFIEFVDTEELINREVENNLLTGLSKTLSNNGQLHLHENLFTNGVLIIPVENKKTINLKSRNGFQMISLDISNFNHVGIWAPNGSQQFICIEPWKGITGTKNKFKQIGEKEEIQILEIGEEHTYELNMKFNYKNLNEI